MFVRVREKESNTIPLGFCVPNSQIDYFVRESLIYRKYLKRKIVKDIIVGKEWAAT